MSDRLIRDRLAEALLALGRAANAVALLATPKLALQDHSHVQLHVPDLLTPLMNATRVAVTIGIGAAMWIEPPWPGGQATVEFGAVITVLFAPQADRAPAIVVQFGCGVIMAAILAAIVEFGVLQQIQSFIALNLALAAVVVPAAFMAAGNWNKFAFVAINFVIFALVAPANEQSYNFESFLNGALGIVVGVLVGLLGFKLVPPVPTRWRTRRLLALALRDVRRFASGRKLRTQRSWLGLATARVLALPPDAEPGDRGRLVSAYSAGEQVIRLRRMADRFRAPVLLEAGLGAVGRGAPDEAIAMLDRLVEAQDRDDAGLRMRAEAVLLIDVLARNRSYFADRPAAPGF